MTYVRSMLGIESVKYPLSRCCFRVRVVVLVSKCKVRCVVVVEVANMHKLECQ